jgi:hypothetical protein
MSLFSDHVPPYIALFCFCAVTPADSSEILAAPLLCMLATNINLAVPLGSMLARTAAMTFTQNTGEAARFFFLQISRAARCIKLQRKSNML